MLVRTKQDRMILLKTCFCPSSDTELINLKTSFRRCDKSFNLLSSDENWSVKISNQTSSVVLTSKPHLTNERHTAVRSDGGRCSHLWHSGSSLMSLLHITPVSSSQRVLQAIWDDSGFNGQFQIEVFSSVDELLSVNPDLLQQVLKHAELREK